MKKLYMTIMTLIGVCSVFANGAEKAPSARSGLIPRQSHVEFREQLQESIENTSIETTVGKTKPEGLKSVGAAVLLSAAVPGAGQFYSGSYLKGAAFLIIEAATLTGYFHFQNRGNELETEFENFADAHWSEEVYWSWVFDECSGDPGWSGGCNDISGDQSLRDYEEWRSDFSHFLPEEKNQQYYENIGKYDQFNIGWDDTNTGGGEDSPRREAYTLMRKDSNDNFKRATTMATVTLFNHVLSALDAGLTVKRHNRRIMQTHIRIQGRLYNREVVPTVTLGMAW